MKHVYVIGRELCGFLEGPVKVGIAASPEQRVKSLQTANAYRLEIVYSFLFETDREAQEIETAFHHKHDDRRLMGEWFDLCPKEASLSLCELIPRIISLRYGWGRLGREKTIELTGVYDILEDIKSFGDGKMLA